MDFKADRWVVDSEPNLCGYGDGDEVGWLRKCKPLLPTDSQLPFLPLAGTGVRSSHAICLSFSFRHCIGTLDTANCLPSVVYMQQTASQVLYIYSNCVPMCHSSHSLTAAVQLAAGTGARWDTEGGALPHKFCAYIKK